MAETQSSRGIANYLNTLIFCIVAKAVTVLLLVLLLFEKVRKYSYLILTVEVCLVAIIIISLVRISSYEKKKAKEAENTLTQKVAVTSCPDYFVKSVNEESDTICLKDYTTPDGRYTYNFTGFTSSNNINLDKNFEKQDLKALCTLMSDTNYPYKNIAWTDIKGKCEWI